MCQKVGVAVRAVVAVLLCAVWAQLVPWQLHASFGVAQVACKIKQNSCVVISLLLQFHRQAMAAVLSKPQTLSFPEVCRVFWVQPIELRCGVAVTASRCQRKLLLRPLSQNVFHNAARCPCCHVAHRSLQCTGQRRSKAKSKSEARSLEKKAGQWVQSS